MRGICSRLSSDLMDSANLIAPINATSPPMREIHVPKNVSPVCASVAGVPGAPVVGRIVARADKICICNPPFVSAARPTAGRAAPTFYVNRLNIHHRSEEIVGAVCRGNDDKQCRLFVTERFQMHIVTAGQILQVFQIEKECLYIRTRYEALSGFTSL